MLRKAAALWDLGGEKMKDSVHSKGAAGFQ